jgi:hypothetical protein
MRKILTRESYLRELNTNLYSKYTGIESINEEAPFATDIPWGDSLIGRLINSISRKSRIAFNKTRISGLVRGLKSIFDEIMEIGKIEIVGDATELINFIKISDLLKLLIEQVRDEEDVTVLINTTEDLIDTVNRYESQDKDKMLKALEEFLEYLKGLKSGKISDDSEGSENELESDSGEDSTQIFYKNSRILLQSIVDLSRLIKQNVVRISGGSEEYENKIISKRSTLKVGSEYLYINSKGEKFRCKLLSLDNKIERSDDKKWLTTDDKKGTKLNKDQACVVYKKKLDDYGDNFKSEVVEILKLYSLDGKEPQKVEKPGKDVSTFFNVEKFKNLEKTYQTSKNASQLKELIKMCQSGVKIFTSKKDAVNIKFYTDKLNSYSLILARQQAKGLNISTTVQKKIAKPGGGFTYKDTGVQKTLKQLQDDISSFSKKTYSIEIPVKVYASFEFETIDHELMNEAEANLGKQEVLAQNAWKKVVKAHNDSKIETYVKSIEDLLAVTVKDGKDTLRSAKKDINSLGKQVILNKSTVGTPISFESLIKEGVNINDLSKSISLFARVILAFKEDMSLVGSYGSVIKPMKSFINSFDVLTKTLPKLTNESVLGFSRFSKLNEKNEFSPQIKEKFDAIFTDDIKEMFTVKDRTELENRVKEVQEGQLVISTSDPIIEIVRLFNRAWRIHTPGVIPSGRTGGKVSNSVFREYENLGGGGGTPDSPGSGPYRNIELYEQWFEAVQDILSDTKYRPVFSENTTFIFRNEETGQSGDPVRKPGKILLSFINRLLSDTKMYTGGSMNKFIEEYFDLKSDKTPPLTEPGFSKDIELNAKTTEEIVVDDVKFAKIDSVTAFSKYAGDLAKLFIDTTKDSETDEPMNQKYKNLCFKVKVKIGDKEKTLFWNYKGLAMGYPIFLFSSGNLPYNLTKVGGDIKKTELPKDVKLASLLKTGATLKVGNTTKVRYADIDEPSRASLNDGINDSRVDMVINSIEILVNKKDNTPYLKFEDNYTPGKIGTEINNNYTKSSVAKNMVIEK